MQVIVSLALKNVIRKKERSLLTFIGVVLAVGSFISLMSLAEGLSYRVNRDINCRKVNVYIMPASAPTLPLSSLGSLGINQDLISPKAQEVIPQIEGVKRAVSVTKFQVVIKNQNLEQNIVVWGIDGYSFEEFFPYLKPAQGTLFSNPNEIVIGSALSSLNGMELDKYFQIGPEQQFKIVGIMRETGTYQDYNAYIPIESARSLAGNKDAAMEMWLQIETPSEDIKVSEEIMRQFPQLKALSKTQYLESMGEYIHMAWIMEFAIAAIGVLIALAAAMNTMLMSTFERIKEFGTLRAIGASRFSVVLMVCLESMILTFAGGLVGIIFGLMGSRLLDDSFRVLLQLSYPIAMVTPGLIGEIIAVCFFVGILAAIIPARIVYKINTMEALRWE